MAIETEIKLSLSPRAASAVAAHPLLAGSLPLRQKLLNTYYDTPDLSLQRERVAVRYRKKGGAWLLTVKCAAPSVGGLARRSEWEVAGQPGDFDFSHVDDRKLRQRLDALRPTLTAAFTTHFTRTAWILETPTGARIELALDRGWIEAAGRREPLCEIELELLDGTVDALFTLARELQEGLGEKLALHPESASKAERGYRLFANTGPQVRRASPLGLHRDMPALAAFRAIALSCVTHLQGNEQGVRESNAPEFIHQSRVAIRRLRSAIRAWQPVLPESFVGAFDSPWRTLASALGDTRNWDVFLTETLPPLGNAFPIHSEIERLSRHALRQLASSRKSARAALQNIAYSRLLLEFTAAVLALPDYPEPSLKLFAGHCLDKRAKKVARLAGGVPGPAAENRHRLRVALKRLRYALEFFEALFPGSRFKSYHQAASRLQELLGHLNDLVFASQFVGVVLPGRQAERIEVWINGRSHLLLQELERSLKAFLQEKKPWKNR